MGHHEHTNLENVNALIDELVRLGRLDALQPEDVPGGRPTGRTRRQGALIQFRVNYRNVNIRAEYTRLNPIRGDAEVAFSDASVSDMDDDASEAADAKSEEPGPPKSVKSKSEKEEKKQDPDWNSKREPSVCFFTFCLRYFLTPCQLTVGD